MKLFQIKNPLVLTIFGASGDLAKLKLFPSLYALAAQKRLPKEFYIIGFARSPKSRKEFQNEFEAAIKKSNPDADKKIIKTLTNALHYHQGQYNHKPDFDALRDEIKNISGKNTLTHLAYFSVPPQVFKEIIQNLGETKRSKNEDLRLIIEKPFGEDTASAKELFHFVARYFEEENVYLLDHYLGKNGVQSILSLRHANRLLNMMMKGPEVANIQITASEKVGVTSRVGYFDQVGTLKDMVQSHLFQILALIAMSIPITDKPDSLKREKNNILSALKFNESSKNIVLGQYDSYKKEKEVPKNSKTETFAALRLFIDRESWYKTPIYIRTGKKLEAKSTYVVIELKKFAFQSKDEEPNRLIFELQPEERINIQLVNKNGITSEYKSINTSESIACSGDDCLPEHANLLLDVIRKNRLHFLSFQEIIASWEITDAIIHFAKKQKVKIENYKDGSRGPKAQDQLTEMDNFKWFEL